jgi:hypothetical protein
MKEQEAGAGYGKVSHEEIDAAWRVGNARAARE